MSKNPVVSGLLRMHRLRLGITQKDVAYALGYNDPATINGWETGRLTVSDVSAEKLCDFLGIDAYTFSQARELDTELKNPKRFEL